MPELAYRTEPAGPRRNFWWSRNRFSVLVLLAAGLACLALGVTAQAQGKATQEKAAATDRGYKVVIHTKNPTVEMVAKDVAKLFLRKIKRWDHGELVLPVDLRDDHPARSAFTAGVHNKSVSAIQSYWQRMIFSGRGEPPQELENEALVLAYVKANPAAIGYVSGDTALGADVRELEITP